MALVAGATRGAGRGTAVALGEAGATVYCTGRTHPRAALGVRPAGDDRGDRRARRRRRRPRDRRRGRPPASPIRCGPSSRASTTSRAASTCWSTTSGAARSWPQWDTPIWEHDLDGGLRMLRLAIDTHLITSHFALPLLIRRPGGLRGRDDRRHARVQRGQLPAVDLLRPGQDGGAAARVRPGARARAARLHRRGADARVDALGDDARDLRRHRGQLARRRRSAARTSSRSPRRRASSAARSPPWPPTPTCIAATAARSPPAGWPASTASPTSTAPSPTAGATSSRSRTPGCRPTRSGYR